MRRCYLNPNARAQVPGEERPRFFADFRANLVRAGFQVVDCPPLTLGGKTSADMVMVMDILDTLAHPTGFEEFIILSSDADFTPVLLRLRAHDRRSLVVAAGSAADAYRAAADAVVRYGEFAQGALGIGPPPPPPVPDPAELREAVLAEVGAPPAAAPEDRLTRMAALVKWLLAQLGNIPLLSPVRLAFVLDALAARLPLPDATATELRQAISDAARLAGHEVTPGAVNAVMHRVGLAGFDWTAPPGEDAPRRLRQALLDNIGHQLAKQRLTLTEAETGLLRDRVGLAAPEPEPEPEPEAAEP